jgi:hypothetical protein
MTRHFELESRFEPAGDQPEAIRRMVEGIDDGEAGLTLLGVTGTGKTLSIANLVAEVQRPCSPCTGSSVASASIRISGGGVSYASKDSSNISASRPSVSAAIFFAKVGEATGHPRQDAGALFNLAQQQRATVGADVSAVEPRDDRAPAEAVKFKLGCATLRHRRVALWFVHS